MGNEEKESRWEVKFSSSSQIDLSGALLEDFCLRSVVELVLCKLPPLRQAHQGQLPSSLLGRSKVFRSQDAHLSADFKGQGIGPEGKN